LVIYRASPPRHDVIRVERFTPHVALISVNIAQYLDTRPIIPETYR
jgi:hypothetical protein